MASPDPVGRVLALIVTYTAVPVRAYPTAAG